MGWVLMGWDRCGTHMEQQLEDRYGMDVSFIWNVCLETAEPSRSWRVTQISHTEG